MWGTKSQLQGENEVWYKLNLDVWGWVYLTGYKITLHIDVFILKATGIFQAVSQYNQLVLLKDHFAYGVENGMDEAKKDVQTPIRWFLH